MFCYMLKFLQPAPAAAPLPTEKVNKTYARYRLQIFLCSYIGYFMYYFTRSNFALAKNHYFAVGFTKPQIGMVASALGIAYGLSKFIMGTLSDRSNPRYFLALGLIGSGLVNLIFPFASSLPVMFTLWLLNGWFQGMGWAPCARLLTHWFSDRERGTKMSIWNTSVNLGAGLIGLTFAVGTGRIFDKWQTVFFIPAVIAIASAILFMIFAKDTPQSIGLPPIEKFKNDYPEAQRGLDNAEAELSIQEILLNFVLNNKHLWYIAIANIFVYFVRYGISGWIPSYLYEVKGFAPGKGSITFALFELAAIPSCILIGWLSDKAFHGRRAPLSIFCLVGVLFAIVAYWYTTSAAITQVLVAVIGAFIYIPVMLIGIAAVDFVPKKAAGAAAGFTGLFGYMGGQVLAEFGMGTIVHHFSWSGGFVALLACCVLAIFFLSFTWRAHDRKAT